VSLVVSAHDHFISHGRLIGVSHTAALVRACYRHAEWDALEALLRDGRRLQLHFVRPCTSSNLLPLAHPVVHTLSFTPRRSQVRSHELLVAFRRLAAAGELERLATLHALLPRAPLERTPISALHHIAIVALSKAGRVQP
jgi:hypothetical protein